MSALLRSRRHRLIAVGLIAAGGLVSGLLVARTGESSVPAVEADQMGDGPLDSRLGVVQRFDDGSHVFAVHWRSDDELWYVSSASDGSLTLHRYSPTTGTTESWLAPIKAVQTIYTFIAEDGGGTLWLGANYTIAAFDPRTERFTTSYELDRRPPELDPNVHGREHFDGSWINGLLADQNGDVTISRHNVKALYRLGQAAPELAAEIERAPTSLILIAGAATPIVREGDETVVVGSDQRFNLPPLGTSECVLKEAGSGQGATLESKGEIVAVGVRLAPSDPVAVDDVGGRVAIGVAHGGVVLVADCSTRSATGYSMGATVEFVDGIMLGADTSAPRRNLHFAEAVALSPSGTLAVGISSGEVAVGR